MSIYPGGKVKPDSGESVSELMDQMPNREVFVKDENGEIVGTGMRMLPDGTLLAPEGFSVESGSIDFGDVITMSESSGFVGIRNNLYNAMYQLVDYGVPRTGPSLSPTVFQLNEAEWSLNPQADDTSILTANPLVFNYTTTLNARTNSITFRASSPMSNVRIKITKSDVNVALKYLPSKSSWSLGTGGMSFVTGDNIVDFKDSPVPLSAGVMLTFEIRANTVALKGNSTGTPYFASMAQRGQFVSIPYSTDVTPTAIRDKLVGLASPNKLPKTAIQDGVFSVNSQFGDVVIPTQVNSDWNSSTGLSAILNKPSLFSGSYTDLTNKPISFPPSGHTHTISDVVGLQTALDGKIATGASIPYATLTGTPSIPSAQVQTDWNAVSGLGALLNKPTTFTPSAHTQAWTTITSTPTTLSGYGITDAYPLASNPSGYLTGITSGQVTAALGFTPYNSTNPNSYVNQTGARTAISLTTTGTSGASTYNSTTGVLNVPQYTAASPVQASATRTLNTAFQISATRNSLVMYSVQITVTASIAGGQNGDVILEIASDAAFTTNVQTVAIAGLGQVYTLAIALQGVQPQTNVVSGFVPAGYYSRLRTVNNTGSPTFTYRSGQEILL